MVRDTNDTEDYGDQAANSLEASTAVVLEAVTGTILTTPTDSERSRNRSETVYHTILKQDQ